jgi:hypothetical protein
MGKELSKVAYVISFMNANGKIVKTVTRFVKGVLNNGVVKKIAKEESINYTYWVFKKQE